MTGKKPAPRCPSDFINEDADLNSQATTVTNNEIIDQFRKSMAEAGVPFSGTIKTDSDKITRFTVEGDKRQAMTGWYILHTDGVAAGSFGCWKRGITVGWCSREMSTLSPEEKAAYQRRMQENERLRREAQEQAWKGAADQARVVWDAASDATDHPYLERKGVRAHGLRVGRWTRTSDDGRLWLDVPNALLVPILEGKKLVSLQAIFPSKDNPSGRDKDFLPGGKKRSCCFKIGDVGADSRDLTIVICEGYATGATIFESTGFPVVIAFDANNLEPVTARIRKAFPLATLVIAADNDRWTATPVENPGVYYATQAGKVHRAWVAVPSFQDLDARPTDFNDLACLEGNDAVRQQILAAITPANDNVPVPVPAPANDNRIAIDQVDVISPLPDVTSKGKPISTIENLAAICRRLGVIIRYNVIKKEEEIIIPGESFSIDNEANASLACLTSWCGRFGMPVGQIGDFVTYLADKHLHNPVANWILSKPWDGQDRLQALMNTVRAAREDEDPGVRELKETMIRKWLISAVAAAFEPNGVSAHGMLVFQGEQYLGKTAWVKSLVPRDLGVVSDGVLLKPDDKDSLKQTLSNWIVELGELDSTFRKSDIAQLKAFLTRDKDVLRRAYAKRESQFARRTVFFASVNPKEFLQDHTGNRRYWTIECESLVLDHGIDMQQLWAQVLTLYQGGEPWLLSQAQVMALNESNKGFESVDMITEQITTRLCWEDSKIEWRYATVTQVMLELGVQNPNRSDLTKAAHILRGLNGGISKRGSNGERLLYVPRARRLQGY